MEKTGRNEPCPCGSGRKFKKCCETKARSKSSPLLMIVVGASLIAALVVTVAAIFSDAPAGTRIWDPAHGHYHDANGQQVP